MFNRSYALIIFTSLEWSAVPPTAVKIQPNGKLKALSPGDVILTVRTVGLQGNPIEATLSFTISPKVVTEISTETTETTTSTTDTTSSTSDTSTATSDTTNITSDTSTATSDSSTSTSDTTSSTTDTTTSTNTDNEDNNGDEDNTNGGTDDGIVVAPQFLKDKFEQPLVMPLKETSA